MLRALKQMISVPKIEADELLELVRQGSVIVLDANTPTRYRRGHIPGAINVDPAGYRREQLKAKPGTPLVFYCTGTLCGAARYAAKRAMDMGETDVRLFTGGIVEWERLDFPVEKSSVA